jgi:hypothetical protein
LSRPRVLHGMKRPVTKSFPLFPLTDSEHQAILSKRYDFIYAFFPYNSFRCRKERHHYHAT